MFSCELVGRRGVRTVMPRPVRGRADLMITEGSASPHSLYGPASPRLRGVCAWHARAVRV
ncbi:hypothetical protein C0216_14810 [Streptomyces globosus]|uniref:Uncharacterized protein n=1 Tax=Streptomyces globosus TaxID=68209 RepID=A0A344U0Z0_9ACTN|nr:hypothetical protein C0216_14810 [Streptomyces globosus]